MTAKNVNKNSITHHSCKLGYNLGVCM